MGDSDRLQEITLTCHPLNFHVNSFQCCINIIIGNSSAGRSSSDPPVNSATVLLLSNEKLAFPAPLSGTVTSIVCSPNFSCHATTVYLPGGTPPIVNEPSGPLTAKNGCLSTP